MYVVVVGSREWQGEWADQQVNTLLDGLHEKYSGLVIVSSSCDKGVGALVKERCLRDKKTFQFIEFHAKVFADLPRSKLSQIFYARNLALAEIGEEFHVFVDESRRGAMEDLVERVEKSGRPLSVHLPKRSVV